jgi:hypothetical protein
MPLMLRRGPVACYRISGPGDHRQPGQRAVGGDGDLERRGLDRVDAPAIGEARPDLMLADSPGTPAARLIRPASASRWKADCGRPISLGAGPA